MQGHGPASHLWTHFSHDGGAGAKWEHENSSCDMIDLIIKGWNELQKEFGVSGPLDMKQLTESLVNRWEGRQILLLLDEIYKKGLLIKLEYQSFP